MTTAAQYQKNRTRKDIIVRRLVTTFGCGVLVTLLVLIWHLVSQTFPLFINPSVQYQQSLFFEFSEWVSAGDILDGEPLLVQSENCGLGFLNLTSENTLEKRIVRPCTHQLKIVEDSDRRWLFDISSKGLVRISSLDITENDALTSPDSLTHTFALPMQDWLSRQTFAVSAAPPNFAVTVSNENGHKVFWHTGHAAINGGQTQVNLAEGVLPLPKLQKLIAYEDNRFSLIDKDGTRLSTFVVPQPIHWISSVEQNRSAYVAYGDDDGHSEVRRWVLNNREGRFVFSPTYTLVLENNEVPIVLQAHADSNAALLLTNQNRLLLFNRTTGEVLDTITLSALPLDISWFGERIYLAFANKVDVYSLDNAAGIVTLNSLFQPTWYEGYSEPQHIYQTSAGSDFNEAKYALVPLFIGSIKAALSAMFIAVPIALGAAIYTGFFASRQWRNRIKPAVEMLEAVPSVVIGFIAAILLVPLADQLLATIALFVLTVPVAIIVIALAQQHIVKFLPGALRQINEVFIAIVGALAWGALCLLLTASAAEEMWLNGWSKTTMVVSLALGIAISPTIFALAEDAIQSVPSSLKNASFALGATRIQTLRSIVLRVAMPGLIAAVMLGFGRAIGETMIVLMVTGNTPIPDWSLLESLRALTANIAIELPEAEVGGALYTMLFFTASALFVFTFVFNTLAEALRHRMRQQVKYV